MWYRLETTLQGDSDIAQRKDIEAKVQAQANDPLFTGQMADQPKEILPLKGRGQGGG